MPQKNTMKLTKAISQKCLTLRLKANDMRNLCALLLFLSVQSGVANGGWIVKTRYYNLYENPLNARVETTYFSKGFMRTDNGDLVTIFNIEKGDITYYNTSNRTYWQGSPEQFNSEIRADFERMIEGNLLRAEEDKRDAMRRMYDETLNSYFPNPSEFELIPRNFSISKVGDGEKVLGHSTQTYKVFEDGQLLETIWISPALTIANEFDFVALSKFLNNLTKGAYANSFESTAQYFDLIGKGYPVKVEIVRTDGYTYISDIIDAKKTTLSTDFFAIPNGFSSASLAQVGVWNGL